MRSLRGGALRRTPFICPLDMPFGECTMTLQDVAFQLGFLVDGEAVSGCLGEFEKFMEGGRPAWEWF
ncbi:uncharacterized protein DS421_3g80110 [Arachis hypogaea]|nr:uncharacterized protein DS421_3g80110 [Arachis hypogaea]